jgi:hypothetical protein
MISAKDFLCPFTRRVAQELHHVTGRDAKGRHLDSKFVVPLSRKQHIREHQSWAPEYSDGVDDDPSRLQLRRIAHFFTRLGEHHEGSTVELPGPVLQQLGFVLHDIADNRKEAP